MNDGDVKIDGSTPRTRQKPAKSKIINVNLVTSTLIFAIGVAIERCQR